MRHEALDRTPLQPDELRDLIRDAEDNVDRLVTRSVSDSWGELRELTADQRPQEDAYIYQHVQQGLSPAFVPLMEMPTDPLRFPHVHQQIFDGHVVTIEATHRGRPEHVYGVDVIYNLGDKKVIAFQHKKADANGAIRLDGMDEVQRRKLCKLCECRFCHPHRAWPFHRVGGPIKPGCSALYELSYPEQSTQIFVSACRIGEILAKLGAGPRRATIRIAGYSKPAVDEMFLRCMIGHIRPEDDGEPLGPDMMYDSMFTRGDLIFSVTDTASEPSKPRRK